MPFTGKVETKSMIRHILTALGVILALVGANQYVPLIDFLTESLDGIFSAIAVLVGVVTTIFGYFKDREPEAPTEN